MKVRLKYKKKQGGINYGVTSWINILADKSSIWIKKKYQCIFHVSIHPCLILGIHKKRPLFCFCFCFFVIYLFFKINSFGDERDRVLNKTILSLENKSKSSPFAYTLVGLAASTFLQNYKFPIFNRILD